jgi:hypothetical protein
MLDWKGVASTAALAVLAAAGLARGQSAPDSAATATHFFEQPLMLDEPATAPAAPVAAKKPLMALLATTPIGPALDSANINLYGFIEAGYTFQFSQPPRGFIAGNVFNTAQARMKLDQADFNIERTVDPAAAAKNHTIDVGGRVEMMYGFDMAKIHSNGMGFYGGGGFAGSGRQDPEDQFDIPQAYVDVALPVGNGLTIRAGKFVTLMGYEVIDAPSNPLYSHSYLFGYAIPFTHTGIMGKYALSDQLTVWAGITRGWNQSLKDNNGAIDFLGEVSWTPTANDTVIVNASEGPQATGDCGDYWTVLDFIYTHKFNDKLSMTVNADYGDAPHALHPKSAQWGGVAVYGQYVMSDYVTFNARGEWYDDYNGLTLGAVPYLSVYEATLGATITPMPANDILKNFQVRPEIRFDYADHKAFDFATDRYQFQFAVDAFFNF